MSPAAQTSASACICVSGGMSSVLMDQDTFFVVLMAELWCRECDAKISHGLKFFAVSTRARERGSALLSTNWGVSQNLVRLLRSVSARRPVGLSAFHGKVNVAKYNARRPFGRNYLSQHDSVPTHRDRQFEQFVTENNVFNKITTNTRCRCSTPNKRLRETNGQFMVILRWHSGTLLQDMHCIGYI